MAISNNGTKVVSKKSARKKYVVPRADGPPVMVLPLVGKLKRKDIRKAILEVLKKKT